jgi:hypothetical protein
VLKTGVLVPKLQTEAAQDGNNILGLLVPQLVQGALDNAYLITK